LKPISKAVQNSGSTAEFTSMKQLTRFQHIIILTNLLNTCKVTHRCESEAWLLVSQ